MPQITLEYSGNLAGAIDTGGALRDLHAALIDTGRFEPDAIKSRAVPVAEFLVGEGGAGKAFVDLRIRILSGREEELKAEIGRRALEVLDEHCRGGGAAGSCQLCVEIVDMRQDLYFKRFK
jgi:5-carboxymethyl-2-hydroxymuconate isomerase